MLSELEKQILEHMSKNLLTTKAELISKVNGNGGNGAELGIQRLKNMGYIETVESLGTCLVLTQSGQRALKG